MNAKTTFGAIAAVSLLAVGGMTAYRIKDAMDRREQAAVVPPPKVPSVAVAVVAQKDVPRVVSITGVVRAQNEAQVFPKMGGRVTRVAVELGQAVKAGDVLALLENNDFMWRAKQAEAQLKAAQAGLENAKVQRKTASSAWERAQGLYKKGALAQADFEQAEAGYALAGVGVQAAEAQVALAEAAVGLANQALSDTRITAPFAGVVARRMVDVGSQASPPQAAFLVQDQTGLEMQGTVPAAHVASLKKGMTVQVRVDELPGRELQGILASVAPSLEGDSRRAAVEVALQPAQGLLPNMFGHAEIRFGEETGALVVPATAVISTADGALIYAVRGSKARVVRPRVGARIGDDVVIEDGLVAGDKVVVSGDAGLEDGTPVAVAGES